MWGLAARAMVVAAIFFAGWHMRDAEAKAAEGKIVAAQAAQAAKAAPAATEASTQAAASRVEIRWRTKLIQEKAREAPLDLDRRYPLSLRFERLHDQAAGYDAPDPGGADATPSDVAPSEATAIIAGNYGAALECFDRLTRLQGLLATYQKIYPPAAATP